MTDSSGPQEAQVEDRVAAQGPDTHELVLATPMGFVRNLGTQYEVSWSYDSLLIAVREGRVVLDREDEDVVCNAGEQLSVGRTGFVRAALPPDDPSWNWIDEISPASSGPSS